MPPRRRAPPDSRPRRPRTPVSRQRLGALLALLGALLAVLLVTGDWRRRLLEEAAGYREARISAERARSARDQQRRQEEQLAAAVVARPGDLEARFMLAQLRWGRQGPAAAIPVLEGWPPDRPEPRALRMLAEGYRLTGREDRTLSLLERAARLFPEDAEVHADRALFFSRLGWLPETREALRRMDAAGGDTTHAELVRIAVARESADLRTAHELLEQTRRREPGNLAVLQQLAAVMSEEGQHEAAARLLEDLPAARDDADSLIAIARIRVQQGTPGALDKARTAVERARALRPPQPGEELLYARCLRLLGRAPEARAILESLYRRTPRLLGLAFELAQVYGASEPEGAVADPASLRAQHAREQRDEEETRRAVLVLRSRPTDPAAHRQAGLLFLRLHNYGRAVVELERALSLKPNDAAARAGLERARRALAAQN